MNDYLSTDQPISPEPSVCERCHQPFEPWPLISSPSPLCHACHNALTAERRAAIQVGRMREREGEWSEVCPPAYRQCTPAKLPSDESRTALTNALGWQPSEGGLGLTGRDSGHGKTRIAFAALRPHFLAGMDARAVLAGQFAIECASRFDNQLDEWLAPLRRTRLLLLDDLGKDRPGERINVALFNLIEHRCAHKLPFVFTSNYAGDELAARFGEHGPYIVRRLRECCRTIVL